MSKKVSFAVLLILLFSGTFLVTRKVKTSYFTSVSTRIPNKLNFLLLGVNNNDGTGDLTDTIMLVSLDLVNRKITLISIPRDIWIEEIKTKINSAYHYGGIDSAKKQILDITGQNVDYYAVVNFNSFEKIINYIGGIEVNVARAFDDFRYPISGKENDLCNGDRSFACRYEHLHFDAGLQTMDGTTALKFARSREALGEEGSDFARSARQELIIQAIKDKILTSKLYLDPVKIGGLIKIIQEEVVTNIKPDQYGSFGELAYKLRNDFGNANMITITEGEFLVHPKYHFSGQWVLLPKSGNWDGLKNYIKEQLD